MGSGQFWTLLTYSFVNSGCGLAFTIAAILFVGSAIEREWGIGAFLLLWGVVGVVCGLIWLMMCSIFMPGLAGMGSDPCVYGLIGAFGLVFRRKRFFFFLWPMEAQTLALIFIGIGMVLCIPRPIFLIWVAGAGVAYLYIRLIWRAIEKRRRMGSSHAKTVPGERVGSFVEID
jgi:membrane associated rhomboid family serine protease